jgi:CO/xanthine dehydrogenase Mo-binding subunit
MAVVESRTFKRQDGKDKVTGLGRYTADMQLAGMTHDTPQC